jgi:hypothetical protein
MNAYSKITVIATVFDGRLADAWRGNAVTVEHCLRFIAQHQKTIAERHERLSTGTLVHKPTDVERAEKLLPWRLSLYLEAVRAVSEYEAKMIQIGMPFARSSYE